jgi:cytoskeleton-associated protein 5
MLRTVDSAQIGFQTKFAELVMKCIWKLTKTLQDSIRQQEINTSTLLFNVHKFYVALPPAEWKRRVADRVPLGDMPQKTIKTILHEVKAAWSDEILSQLNLIPDVEKSYLYSYLSHIVDPTRRRPPQMDDNHNRSSSRIASIPENASDDDDGSTTSGAGERGGNSTINDAMMMDNHNSSTHHSTSSTSATATNTGTRNNDPVHATLSQIFMKISTSERTKQVIIVCIK